MSYTILFTGGHPTPALAVIDELLRVSPEVRLVFVGRPTANANEPGESFEHKEITARKIRFISCSFERGLRGAVLLPFAIAQAINVIQSMRAMVIMSFGGYIGLPYVIAGWLLCRRRYVHEQTIVPGTGNRIAALFANHTYTAFPEALRYFPSCSCSYIGNPIRRQIYEPPTTTTVPIPPASLPLLYVTGGNIGSHAINKHIFAIITRLVDQFVVVHQTGNMLQYNDIARSRNVRDSLPDHLRARYIPLPHLSSTDHAYMLHHSSCIVTRTGANTFFELLAVRRAVVCVPLPWSAHHEQEHHAQLLQTAGVGAVFNQDRPSDDLLHLIQSVYAHKKLHERNYTKLSTYARTDAASCLANVLASQ
jgi:UDP-N-acetylglucosamine--N-acetylmuramyl-(pentapeptide) pyrophosphoryl-undecaprenol N-acetylglucosamine transferase